MMAGGRSDLPDKLAKLVKKHNGSTYEGERYAIVKYLWDKGYFLDFVGICWNKNKVPEIARKHDENYKFLAGIR